MFLACPALVLLAATAIGLAGVVTMASGAAAAVEDDGADCPVSVPASWPSTAKLPDPFKKIDGTRISAKADWRCRRAEIKELAERYVYGEKHAKPASVTGTVSGREHHVNV